MQFFFVLLEFGTVVVIFFCFVLFCFCKRLVERQRLTRKTGGCIKATQVDPAKHYLLFANFTWTCRLRRPSFDGVSLSPAKILFGIFEFLSVRFLMFFIYQKFQIHHCSLWRNQKPQSSWKRVIVEQNGMKFGTCGWYFNIYRVPLAF